MPSSGTAIEPRVDPGQASITARLESSAWPASASAHAAGVGPVYELELPDLAATDQLGEILAGVLMVGQILAVDGELGAGKTTLIRAIVAALGGDPAQVASPTFSLVNHYQGRVPIVHMDAYRLTSGRDLAGLGFDEFSEEAVVLLEWPLRVRDGLAGHVCWDALIEHLGGGRRARLKAPDGKRLQAAPVTWKVS